MLLRVIRDMDYGRDSADVMFSLGGAPKVKLQMGETLRQKDHNPFNPLERAFSKATEGENRRLSAKGNLSGNKDRGALE